MSENPVKNFFIRAGKFIKRIAKIVWEYLKVAKMEWIVMVSLFLLDILSKTIVEKTLGFNNAVTVIPHFLDINLIPNYNAAYGADFISNWLGPMGARIFFSVFAVAASVAFILVLIKNKGKSKVFRIGIAMFVAGAMGNCIDRMFIGYVRDFVHFTFQPYIFNIADAELVFGVVLIVVYFIFLYKDHGKKKEESAPLVDELGEIDPVDMTAATAEKPKASVADEHIEAEELSESSEQQEEDEQIGELRQSGSEKSEDTEQVNTDATPSDGGDT